MKTNVQRLLDHLPDGKALCLFDFHPGQVIIDWMTANHGHPLADVARTSIILRVGQLPGAGWAMWAITYFWRGLFYRSYIARYLELHPGLTSDEITTWMVPVAARRLKEAIPGEQDQLLAFIQANADVQ